MGCERNPNLIYTAAGASGGGLQRTLGNSVSEYEKHPRHLVYPGIQPCIVGRREHGEIVSQKDVIIQFTRRTQCDRQVTRELCACRLTASLGDIRRDRHRRASHLIDERPITSPLKRGLSSLMDLQGQCVRPLPN
jgi:hypothetical protein